MGIEETIMWIVIPVLLALVVSPMVSLFMLFKLRGEQKRQSELIAMLFLRRDGAPAQPKPVPPPPVTAPAAAFTPATVPLAKSSSLPPPVPMAKPAPVRAPASPPDNQPPPVNELQARAVAVLNK
ncbi:MAG: hypothetical protein NT121_22365, partial [Chloroflexi bacterium]|nr:hypothetical protein [Chloroflexota bacterium]